MSDSAVLETGQASTGESRYWGAPSSTDAPVDNVAPTSHPTDGNGAAVDGALDGTRADVDPVLPDAFLAAETQSLIPSDPQCPKDVRWANPTLVEGLSGKGSYKLLAMTPDERTIVFSRGNALFGADRDGADQDFARAFKIALSSDHEATEGVGLSPDGLRLVLVSADGQRLGEIVRPTTSEPFRGSVDESRYQGINLAIHQAGQHIASPVVDMSDAFLYFNSYVVGAYSSIFVASKTASGTYLSPTRLSESTLDGAADQQRRLPVAMSSDRRTLFYFNEQSNMQEVRWSSSDRAAFYDVSDLGARRDAHPNAACTRLYSSRDGTIIYESR